MEARRRRKPPPNRAETVRLLERRQSERTELERPQQGPPGERSRGQGTPWGPNRSPRTTPSWFAPGCGETFADEALRPDRARHEGADAKRVGRRQRDRGVEKQST